MANGVEVDLTELGILGGLTASAAELNKLDGATVTTAELNILDGVTATKDELNLTDNMVAGATIVVGAESDPNINVTIQFTDAAGADMATPVCVPWYLADDAAGLDPASVAHSGGAAIGTDGALIESVANLSGLLISEADGDADITFNEAGALTKYLVLVMPNGSLVISDAITHAA
jgi:hypothetical protein